MKLKSKIAAVALTLALALPTAVQAHGTLAPIPGNAPAVHPIVVASPLMGYPAYRACLQNQVREFLSHMQGRYSIEFIIDMSSWNCLTMMM